MNTPVEDVICDLEDGHEEEPTDVALRPDLTPRQLEILSLIARGRSNKEIASHLGISERTVKFHVAALLKKLSAFSRTEALVVGLRLRLIELESEG